MVIRLDGWGLVGWIFIGVSMEKEWPGQQCLSITEPQRCAEIRCYVTRAQTHVVHHRYRQTPGRKDASTCSSII